MTVFVQRDGETYSAFVARANPPKDSGLCPLCWPDQHRPSLAPPYGACRVCTAQAHAGVTPVLERAGETAVQA